MLLEKTFFDSSIHVAETVNANIRETRVVSDACAHQDHLRRLVTQAAQRQFERCKPSTV